MMHIRTPSCITLPRTATHCRKNNTLQHTAAHCNVVHQTAICCTKLQYIVPHCNTQSIEPTHMTSFPHIWLGAASHCNTLQHTATHCNTLRHTATHCNAWHDHCLIDAELPRTATHWNTLQHTATHCSTPYNTLQRNTAHCTTHYSILHSTL